MNALEGDKLPEAGDESCVVCDRLVCYLRDELGFKLMNVNLEEIVSRVKCSITTFDSFESFAATISSLIAVHETYFLRHHEHFSWLENVWVQKVLSNVSEQKKPIRILSAGCATGEEPYSIYAHLQPIFARHGYTLEVDAVDISKDAISFAKKGSYGLWSMRGVVFENESDWLSMLSRHICVKDWVKRGVNFYQKNITKEIFSERKEYYDLILCRNVMIYMHEKAVESVLDNLTGLLRSSGYILPGPSDPNPAQNGDLKIEWEAGVRLFTRRDNELPVTVASEDGESNFTKVIETYRSSSFKIHFHEETIKIPEIENVETSNAAHLSNSYSGIESLIKSCQYDVARKLLEANIKKNPLDTRSYVMLAMLAMELDDIDLANYSTKKASFLSESEPYPIYLLANYKQKTRDRKGERKCLQWVKEVLVGMESDKPLKYCEEISVEELLSVVEQRLC